MKLSEGLIEQFGSAKSHTQMAAESASTSSRLLQLSVHSMPIALIVMSADERFTIKEWNPAAEAIYGYMADEAIGQSAVTFLVPEPDQKHFYDPTRMAAHASHPMAGVVRSIRKDGATIWVRFFNTPLHGPDGSVTGFLAMAQDITEQRQNEERLRLWATVLEQSTEAILICDIERRIILVNRSFEEITGYKSAEVLGQTPRLLQSGRHDRQFYAKMWKRVERTGQWRGEIWNRRKSGELYVEWLSLSAVRDEFGAVSHYIGIFSDITERKQTEERVRHLAHFDALTNLPNRALLLDRAAQMLANARRERKKMALLFMDLDRFKNINDSMGHEAGDELLTVVAKRLLHRVRETDTVARMGGDEFVVALGQIDSLEAAAKTARDMLDAIMAPITLRGQDVSISGSVGICLFPDDAQDVSEMIRNADAAMYRAKRLGRNTYQFYTRDMNERALEMLATEMALRNAVERNELVLHYQPQIDIRSRAIVGLEALIRWNRPGVGLTMPGQFIQIAEDRGLISAIGAWTLREATRQAAAWDREGRSALPIAVNLSASEFHQHGFVERVQKTIRENDLHPGRIELEITEGVIARDTPATIDILNRLHDFGVQLSIDDFGTGYSSLNYLRRFPIDKIKIDQSFIREMFADDGAAGIVRGMIGLAQSLRLKTVAEGVETVAQFNALRDAGCDIAQGFWACRALEPSELQQFIDTWAGGSIHSSRSRRAA